MPPVSQCQKTQLITFQKILEAAGNALWKAGVALVYALCDAIDLILSAFGVLLAGIVALANVFLAGVKAVVELVASAVGGIASAINSVVNAFGGQCKESNATLNALKYIASGLTALKNTLTDWANGIGLWMQSISALEDQLASGTNFVKNVVQIYVHYP